MKKFVKVNNLRFYFESVIDRPFLCLSKLEDYVVNTDALEDFVLVSVNNNRDAVFLLTGMSKDKFSRSTYYFDFKETIS